MTDTDRIAQMAREAGLDPYDMSESPRVALNNLARFARLVAEDCAKVCEDEAKEWDEHAAQDAIDLEDKYMSLARVDSLTESAQAIRARYSKEPT